MSINITAKNAEEALQTAAKAKDYFERFDKSSLYYCAAHQNTNWLLSETSHPVESPGALISGLQPPDSNGKYSLFIPRPNGCSAKQFNMQELHQVVRELVNGIYLFNQTPCISLEPNQDSSSTCFIPPAYHDTLVGETLFSVDYFMKSVLHGSTIPQKDKRSKLVEEWKKLTPDTLHAGFSECGLVTMQSDQELGEDLYVEKKEPFIRYPPRHVDSSMAHDQLTLRLTTGEEHDQNEDHLSRDMFLRYLDHVSIGLVFSQKTIQQNGSLIFLDPTYDITTGVLASQRESDPSLYCRLNTYLQKQRNFLARVLPKKRDIVHDLELLSFISFMIQFLVTLKKQNKIIDVHQLLKAKGKDVLRTDREIPPILPTPSSRWSPFTSKNGYTSMHGKIDFHNSPQEVQAVQHTRRELSSIQKFVAASLNSVQPTSSATGISASSSSKLSTAICGDVQTYDIGEKSYYILNLAVEPYYLKTPKLPPWVHSMFSEFKSQCGKLPLISDGRIQDMLKKSLGQRKAAMMKTVNVSLQASIEKGVLPAVGALLKRCTQTRLSKPDDKGLMMIHYAASNGRAHILSALVLAGSSADQPVCSGEQTKQQPTNTLPIHLAVQSGSLEALCCLQRYDADICARDDDGWSPIHHAAFHNYQVIIWHFVKLNPTYMELETTDKHVATPLLLAAKNGCFDAFTCLVESGANLSVSDSSGSTAIHLAALHHHVDVLKYLIDLKRPEVDVWAVLSEMLKSETVSGHAEAAARSLDPLTQWRPEQSDQLLKHNAVQPLVRILREEKELQHLAIQVLANLSNLEGIKSALVRAKAIPNLVKLLSSANDRIQACTCVVLSDLAVSCDNQVAIVESKAMPLLVKLLSSQSDDVQLYSCACIGILAYDNPKNQTAVSEAGGIPLLVSLLKSPLSCIQSCAASALQAVLEGNRNNQLTSLAESIIPPLVVLLRSKQVPVHKNAARAIEALAENCEESQCELLSNPVCINLLKRLLKMRDPNVKLCGGCALWAIAGVLISNKRLIATHMGLELLVDMLTIHNEKLDYVCSEALGALASELGDNQNRIIQVGGVKPLVEVLTLPTSQRVCLSVIHTLAALCMKPALVPNPVLQKSIASARGIVILSSIISASQATEIVRVEAACTLAKLVLDNPENDMFLAKHTDFSFLTILKFFISSDVVVRLQAGYCLAILAFNNSSKLEKMKAHGCLNITNFVPFLQSEDEFFRVHAAFQIVVLSKLLTGIRDVDAVVQGIKLLVQLQRSDIEQTKVLSAEFVASLAHSQYGIPNTLIMAGVLDPLMLNLSTGNGPVIESTSVALGYLTFNPMASRLIVSIFRDNPDLFRTFEEYFAMVVYSQKFLKTWNHITRPGLPSLSLECRGGPCSSSGKRTLAPSRGTLGTSSSQRQPIIGLLSTTTTNTVNTTDTVGTGRSSQPQQYSKQQSVLFAKVEAQDHNPATSSSNAQNKGRNQATSPNSPARKSGLRNMSVSFEPKAYQPPIECRGNFGLLTKRKMSLPTSAMQDLNKKFSVGNSRQSSRPSKERPIASNGKDRVYAT